MDPDTRAALIHMLLAQREQIEATLRLLAKQEPAEEPADPRPEWVRTDELERGVTP